MANAENNNNMNIDNLYISTIYVDAGPIMKRVHPRSRGQAFGIMKRTSTLTVKVSEKSNRRRETFWVRKLIRMECV